MKKISISIMVCMVCLGTFSHAVPVPVTPKGATKRSVKKPNRYSLKAKNSGRSRLTPPVIARKPKRLLLPPTIPIRTALLPPISSLHSITSPTLPLNKSFRKRKGVAARVDKNSRPTLVSSISELSLAGSTASSSAPATSQETGASSITSRSSLLKGPPSRPIPPRPVPPRGARAEAGSIASRPESPVPPVPPRGARAEAGSIASRPGSPVPPVPPRGVRVRSGSLTSRPTSIAPPVPLREGRVRSGSLTSRPTSIAPPVPLREVRAGSITSRPLPPVPSREAGATAQSSKSASTSKKGSFKSRRSRVSLKAGQIKNFLTSKEGPSAENTFNLLSEYSENGSKNFKGIKVKNKTENKRILAITHTLGRLIKRVGSDSKLSTPDKKYHALNEAFRASPNDANLLKIDHGSDGSLTVKSKFKKEARLISNNDLAALSKRLIKSGTTEKSLESLPSLNNDEANELKNFSRTIGLNDAVNKVEKLKKAYSSENDPKAKAIALTAFNGAQKEYNNISKKIYNHVSAKIQKKGSGQNTLSALKFLTQKNLALKASNIVRGETITGFGVYFSESFVPSAPITDSRDVQIQAAKDNPILLSSYLTGYVFSE